MQGLFITVEGIDGSGKTTVANAVAERLRQEGFAVVVTAALSFGQVRNVKGRRFPLWSGLKLFA
jgi:thymidylate kinase